MNLVLVRWFHKSCCSFAKTNDQLQIIKFPACLRNVDKVKRVIRYENSIKIKQNQKSKSANANKKQQWPTTLSPPCTATK